MQSKPQGAPLWWPVRYPGAPGAEDGCFPAFEVVFAPKTAAQMAALMRGAVERKLTDAQLVIEAVEVWRGKLSLGAEPGSPPVPFSAVALQLASAIEPCFVFGVMRALMEYAAQIDPERRRSVRRILAGAASVEMRHAQPR